MRKLTQRVPAPPTSHWLSLVLCLHAIEAFHPNGARASEGPMDGAFRHGLWTEWSADGKVVMTEEWEHGRRVRQNGRLLSPFVSGLEGDHAFYIRRSPQVAILRVVDILPGLPRALDSGHVIFEVVQPIRGEPSGRISGFTMSLSHARVRRGSVAIAGIEPGPHEVLVLGHPPQSVEGTVTGVILVPSEEEARKQLRTLVPGL